MMALLTFILLSPVLVLAYLEWRNQQEKRALTRAIRALEAAHECLSRDSSRLQAAKQYVEHAERILRKYPRYATMLESNVKITKEMILWCEIRSVSDPD
jgi:hypothetical protein